mmetsp:Transcript_79798/g.222138  ORF Transcript_79798/g.222138 Transcript_79798/m.222138 type:complete len:239 (+) Transcript_79798:141-857(+)
MPVNLQYTDPAPLVLGTYPMTKAVQAICVVHALGCLFVLATSSSVVAIEVANFKLSPTVQVVCGAWSVLGIMVIVGALLGCNSRQEFPVRAYYYYCVVSTIAFGVLLWYVAATANGRDCGVSRSTMQSQRMGRSLTCGMVNSALFLAVLAVLALCAFATYTVWQLKEYLWQREQAEPLLGLEDPTVKKLRGTFAYGVDDITGDNKQATDMGPDKMWSNPNPGFQPAWGEVPIRSVQAA